VSEHRLTRAKLLRHAAAGAAATAASGTGAGALGRLLDVAAAADLTPAAAGAIHHFRSRPDLKPPVVRVLQRTDSVANGYVLLAPSSGPGQRGPMIIDDAGNVVWFHRTKKFVVNLRAALYRGRPVLTWWEGEIGQGLGLGEHVIVDSSYRELARFPAGRHRGGDLHELVLTPSGTALVTAWSAVTRNLLSLGGKRRHRVVDGIAQEIEIPSARVLFEWRSINHVPLSESHVGVGPQFDYFHINSIDVAPDGDLIVSARNTWTIYKISRKTGKIVWRLGGKKSDFALSRNARFAWQHDARVHGDGSTLSLFDDGAAPAVERESRGLVFQLDGARKRATLLRMYRHRPHKLLAYYMGSMQLLPNGNAMLGWGSAPYITEFGEDGSIVFDATLPRGGQTYRAVRMPWSGRPATPPALAASNGRLYASWNGSTELAAWHVRSGSSPTTLQDAATVPASGFETAITLTGSPAYAAVTALDAVGTPLSTSKTVRV
jgi:hypothetical protein